MKQMSDDDVAVAVLQIFRGHDAQTVMSAIARIAASAVIGGACNRDQLFEMIQGYMNGETN
jgi:hypothetical protein